ncbi:MAG: SCP2 sterol-binding domain-containing protein [Acetatifactor sp.]|nr:SCP2 sterol-binding domain-containing protein [Acetatifactor sp.]
MTYEELVKQVGALAEKADASKIPGHVAFQFNIEGEAAGAFYLEISDGKVNVQPYEYYDRDVLVTCTADTLLKIVSGKLDPIWAFTTKKIKVEGDLGKAVLLKEVVGK